MNPDSLREISPKSFQERVKDYENDQEVKLKRAEELVNKFRQDKKRYSIIKINFPQF